MVAKSTLEYWDDEWKSTHLPRSVDVVDRPVRRPYEYGVFRMLSRLLPQHVPASGAVLEVGCAASIWLPVLARRLGYRVAGLDYSPEGCALERALLAREGIEAEIVCGDLFDPPAAFIDRFDALISFGLVEHFTPTEDVVRALARMLRPGGLLFTMVPNLSGWAGAAQRWVDPAVYAIHVPLTRETLEAAHVACGLEPLESGYHLPVGLAIVNAGGVPGLRGTALRWVLEQSVRATHLIGAFVPRARPLRATRRLSGYAYCAALKPERPLHA